MDQADVPGSLVVVSNRGPLSFRPGPDGAPVRAESGGGLAATLRDLLAGTGATWVSVAMGEADRQAARQGLMVEKGLSLHMVLPEPEVYAMAYDVVSNATLWFCHHHLWDLPRRPRLDRRWQEAWTAYRSLNEQCADAVAEVALDGAPVLVQDYHLSLVGQLLRARRPDLRTVHFTHTPFGSPVSLRVLPSAAAGELLAGMAGFGACGFHTARWEEGFRNCLRDPTLARRAGDPQPPRTFAAPLGPDPETVCAGATAPEAARARQALAEQVGGRRLVVRVDRVELSKNILRGIWAMDELFEAHPEWRGAVVLLALAYPSREGLADYLSYRAEIEHAAAVVNETWGTPDWTPVLLDVADDRARSVAALCDYDVLLVNPIRDGLNLVAKEGPLVNDRHGVLVLSEETGAWDELCSAAVGVNPYDVAATAAALHQALAMPGEEREVRAAALRALVLARPASAWLDDQLAVAAGLGDA